MALNHVAIRDDKHGLVRVSPEEAAMLYPYGLTAHAQHFVCEVCMQHTLFIAGGKNRPHFKHNRGSNDCDEKLSVERGVYSQTNPLGFSLPTRISIKDRLIISIGFLPLSEVELSEAAKKKAQVCIAPCDVEERIPIKRVFNIDQTRFSFEHISYLDIGNTIAEKYKLSFNADERFSIGKEIWPRYVKGFSSKGTLFDFISGKRLPNRSTVVVGRDYYLFAKNSYICSNSDVSCLPLTRFGQWDTYKVRATKLSSASVDFFRHLNLFLTDRPSSITLLWPAAWHSSHLISFCGDKTYFHKTSGHISVFPTSAKMNQLDDAFFSVLANLQQILSVSRFENKVGVLRYTLLRKEAKISRVKNKIPVHLSDLEGNPINTGIPNALPKHRKAVALLEYDGYIEVLKDGVIINKVNAKADTKITVDIDFNRTYRIFQGLDMVSEVSFKRTDHVETHLDDDMVRKLKGFRGATVAINHSFGAMANKLSDSPKTRSWLLKQLRVGTISQDALIWLKTTFEGRENHV